MLRFPTYFIGKEIKLETDGTEQMTHFAVEKIDSIPSPKLTIVEEALAFTPHGSFPLRMTVHVSDDNSFSIRDESGTFEGCGIYIGTRELGYTAMKFFKAHSKLTHEIFDGSYLFLSEEVRAQKHWYRENDFGKPGALPSYATAQRGFYISEADYQRLRAHPSEIPSFWSLLNRP